MAIEDKNTIAKVEASIDQLRPFLEADGGDMELVEITDDMIVRVKLIGACSNCSMSPMTLRAGLEENLRSVLPEIKGVESISKESYV